ncbi:MAG: acetylornithine transaminase [Acidobacteriota bacterium]|nr:acetylornithine transaminase [Blastocatellia bacterium]MDW8239787.1 acetylornithine transaminase [Acidobacteriota bacterium]
MSEHVRQLEDRFQLPTYKKFPLVIERGDDVWLLTDQGERYLDLYGGHAVAVTGHCHRRVVAAIQRQVEKLIFYSNLVYNDARAEAVQKLIEIAPVGLSKVFFVNSGAEANENAIKLARKLTGRTGIISFEGGFHGRTMAALSATGSSKYHKGIAPLVPDHHHVPFGDLQAVAAKMNETVAGVLLEPIQSMAGVRMASAEFYQGLRRLCNQYGALLIYDEVQTGMGRTGEFFFAPRWGVTPDIMTLAKGIASGVPMGAVLVTEAIASRVGYGDFGTTFGGGPLACAALTATLEVIAQEQLLDNVRQQSRYLMERCQALSSVEQITGLGFLLGIRFKQPAAAFQQGLLQRRILTGLADDPHVLRVLPPLTLRQPEIDLFINALSQVEEELL